MRYYLRSKSTGAPDMRLPAPFLSCVTLRIWPCLLLAVSLIAQAEPLVVTLTTYQTVKDPLKSYNGLVLALALEKTRAEYGDYTLNSTPEMNSARAQVEIKANRFPNQIVMTSFQNKVLDEGIDYARFPVEYGVTGYRICFVSPQAKAAIAKVKTVDELRKFTIGQGVGWADTEILRFNGFRVEEVSMKESLFRMVAANRVDLFCRGINELEGELKERPEINGLDYDRTFAIAYPLPRFFMASKQNAPLLERIGKGLQIAHKDGSLRKLWLDQYGSALRFANLKQRKIFQLNTPHIDRIDFDYQKLYFDPRK